MRTLSGISIGSFVGLLAILHVIKSDLDPSWHFISEYAIGDFGWLMQLAFVALAMANLSTWMSIRGHLTGFTGHLGTIFFILGTVGVILGAVFVTDPINTPPQLQTTHGRLHNAAGGLGLLGFVGSLLLSWRLWRSENLRHVRIWVAAATGLLVISFVIAFASIASLAASSGGVFGPETPVGWPNRIGILGACVWLALISYVADAKSL
ncbi:MAG: DUF998 domain-containing protein [Planctomycetaceae bacterium]|nr:DUF998 domain-containing protein [Planctomycetaceae bacterium]